MSNKFVVSAIESSTLSPLMKDRDKLSIDDLINTYPDGVTVIGFDFVSLDDETEYFIFIFSEDKTKFFSGGTVLNNIAADWIGLYPENTDIEEINRDLEDEGGVKIKIEKGKTRKGNNLNIARVVG